MSSRQQSATLSAGILGVLSCDEQLVHASLHECMQELRPDALHHSLQLLEPMQAHDTSCRSVSHASLQTQGQLLDLTHTFMPSVAGLSIQAAVLQRQKCLDRGASSLQPTLSTPTMAAAHRRQPIPA